MSLRLRTYYYIIDLHENLGEMFLSIIDKIDNFNSEKKDIQKAINDYQYWSENLNETIDNFELEFGKFTPPDIDYEIEKLELNNIKSSIEFYTNYLIKNKFKNTNNFINNLNKFKNIIQ